MDDLCMVEYFNKAISQFPFLELTTALFFKILNHLWCSCNTNLSIVHGARTSQILLNIKIIGSLLNIFMTHHIRHFDLVHLGKAF